MQCSNPSSSREPEGTRGRQIEGNGEMEAATESRETGTFVERSTRLQQTDIDLVLPEQALACRLVVTCFVCGSCLEAQRHSRA